MPLLEIEQKFSFTLANLALLTRNLGSPPFKTLADFRTQAFRDTYYDSHNQLSNAGLWLRKRHLLSDSSHPSTTSSASRAPQWEAKQSAPGSSFLRSTFSETKDRRAILALVRAHFPADPRRGLHNDFGLDAIADFETYRYAFLADGKFTVVLDKTSFGHQVGEVEVLAEDAEGAHAEIDTFCEMYRWFIDREGVKGKLTAYFERYGFPKDGA